jgi:hypothetical protein
MRQQERFGERFLYRCTMMGTMVVKVWTWNERQLASPEIHRHKQSTEYKVIRDRDVSRKDAHPEIANARKQLSQRCER